MPGIGGNIKTGLLFGSFNPVHIGHIAIAAYTKEFAGMDEIWFIVSPQNPFKSPENLASPQSRLQMVNLATKSHKGLITSDIEFSMPVPSYTLDTMKKLKESHPEKEFWIITGTDNISSIISWKGGRTLVRQYNFLVYPRPGSDNSRLDFFSNATVMDAPVIEISSSFIRRSIKEGKDMRAFVPSGAYDFLMANKLYT